jgi:hypothetical protein
MRPHAGQRARRGSVAGRVRGRSLRGGRRRGARDDSASARLVGRSALATASERGTPPALCTTGGARRESPSPAPPPRKQPSRQARHDTGRLSPRGAAPPLGGVRPHRRPRDARHVSRAPARPGDAPRREGGRHRRQPPHPGTFFYDNMAMGLTCWRRRAARAPQGRRGRHHLRVPEVCPRALPRRRPLERLPRGDQRALRHRQEGPAGDGPGLPPGVRLQLRDGLPGEPLRAAGQLRPRRLARDPGDDPQVHRRRRPAASRTSPSGATARPRASSSTSTTAPRASCSRPSATTTPTRSTSAPASRSPCATSPPPSARPHGLPGDIVWDAARPNGQPRRMLDVSAPASASASRPALLRRRPRPHHRVVPRQP